MKVICKSYKDCHKFENWPEVFVFPPQKGDLVKSANGVYLKIVEMTHCFIQDQENLSQTPVLIIGLA